jgi:hypothetical protein
MSDNLKKTGKQDDIRINVNQDHEIQYWTKKFGITSGTLKAAVKAAGVMVENVERWLKENDFIKC